jgi:hypothetical protein
MAGEIQEVQLDIPDITEQIQDIEEHKEEKIEDSLGAKPQSQTLDASLETEPQSEIQAALPESEPPVKKAKAKGRPKGALNKAPSKPRAKKKIREVASTSQEDVPLEFREEYEPSSPRRNFRIGESDLAAQMFRLLQAQEDSRLNRKRQLYASWFRSEIYA